MSLNDTNLADLLRLHAEKNPDGIFACFNGDYPVSVQMEFDKLSFEARESVRA